MIRRAVTTGSGRRDWIAGYGRWRDQPIVIVVAVVGPSPRGNRGSTFLRG